MALIAASRLKVDSRYRYLHLVAGPAWEEVLTGQIRRTIEEEV